MITSCVAVYWGEFLAGNPNNQMFTIETVITIPHVNITAVTPISSSFHPSPG